MYSNVKAEKMPFDKKENISESVENKKDIKKYEARLDDLQDRLKTLYSLDSTIPPIIRTEEKKEQSIDDYYVNLQMIIAEDQANIYENSARDRVSGEKEHVGLEQIFDKVGNTEATNKVFILGGPGVGKTTLLHSMSYKWAHDGIWQDKFDFVIRIRLKDALSSQNMYKGKDALYKFIAEGLNNQKGNVYTRDGVESEEPDDFTVDEVKTLLSDKELQNKILLLVDGYDEFVSRKGQESYTRIVSNENGNNPGILAFPNVVMSSRPSAVDPSLLDRFNRKIENTGLDIEGVNQYIDKFYQDDKEGNAENLKGFLAKHGTIKDICKTPINLSLICMIWEDPAIQQEIKDNIDHGNFKVSQLYDNILLKLTKKAYEHSKKDEDVEHYHVNRITKNNMFRDNVLKAIKDVAFYHFTSGDREFSFEGSDQEEEGYKSGGANGIRGELLDNFIEQYHDNTTNTQ